MDARQELLARVHALLPAGHDVREVSMFGGVSVMLDDELLVAAGKDGSLLVRVDPSRGPELLGQEGASPAVMGADREMGPGWVRVDPDGVGTRERLGFWLAAALDHWQERRPATGSD